MIKNNLINSLQVLLIVVLNLGLLVMPVMASQELETVNNQVEVEQQLIKTGPSEIIFSSIGLVMITLAVIYWYRSTLILKITEQIEDEQLTLSKEKPQKNIKINIETEQSKWVKN